MIGKTSKTLSKMINIFKYVQQNVWPCVDKAMHVNSVCEVGSFQNTSHYDSQ